MNLLKGNLAKNLSCLMANQGTSSSELARKIGVPYNTINRIVLGVTTDPKLSTLKLIADFFNVSLDAIAGNSLSVDKGEQTSPKMVPVFTWTDISELDLDNFDLRNWTEWKPVVVASDDDLGSKAFALVSKYSMAPKYPPNTVFVIDPDIECIDGDTVLVRILENNKITLRTMLIDHPSTHLVSMNEKIPPIPFEKNKYRVLGVVVFTMIYGS